MAGWFMVLNATFNNISAILWVLVLLVEETRWPGENHWPVVSHWQTLSHTSNVGILFPTWNWLCCYFFLPHDVQWTQWCNVIYEIEGEVGINTKKLCKPIYLCMNVLENKLKVWCFKNNRSSRSRSYFGKYMAGWFMVLNATFNNISAILWGLVLLVEETRWPGENHRPVASNWQTLLVTSKYNVTQWIIVNKVLTRSAREYLYEHHTRYTMNHCQ
jgi:hypothetical protein